VEISKSLLNSNDKSVLQAPEAAMVQYNGIADAIETLNTFPERIKLIHSEELCALGLRQMLVDNFSVFFHAMIRL
jgi:hypothetical protein